MLGWHISVFRQRDGGAEPARADSPEGGRVAKWQTPLGGRDWLRELVARGDAFDLGGDGYPVRYTARAEHLVPRILAGPPLARTTGDVDLDHVAAAACAPSEWLLVVAWDES